MFASRRDFLRCGTISTGAAVLSTASQSYANATEPHAVTDLRQQLLTCLGGPWPEPCDLHPETHKVEQRDGYTLQWVRYDAEPKDRIPAIAMIPDGVSAQSPAPAIAIWHQHAGHWHLGKSEPAGLAGDAMHFTGVALVKLGYVVLCPDALCFEDRQDPAGQLRKGDYERHEFLRYVVQGRCMAWKNILDMRRAIDYLVSRDDVRHDRIGCYGHSMGSTHTWLVGPWEPRIRCMVGNCCLPTYEAIHRHKLLHCFPNFVPGWQRFGDTPDMAGMIAPRALHLNLGELDKGSPIEEARAGLAKIAAAYQAARAADQFSYFMEADVGHVLSPAMWQKTHEFFDQHLT